MPTITTKDGTQIYLQGLGNRPAHRLQPRLAAHGRRLGLTDDVLRPARLPGHRATTGADTAVPPRPGTATTWIPMPMISRPSLKSST